ADFQAFDWQGEVPDPQAESTFWASKLNRGLAEEEPHRTLLRFYQMLMRFRREKYLKLPSERSVIEYESSRALMILRSGESKCLAMMFHFDQAPTNLRLNLPAGGWEKRIDSADLNWLGPGASVPATVIGARDVSLVFPACSFAVFERTSTGWE